MALCNDMNLRQLKKSYKSRILFKSEFPTTSFLLICEILNNLKKKRRFRKCFNKKILKDMKRHKKIIDVMMDEKKSSEKRKEKYLQSKPAFQKWLINVIKRFFKRCLTYMND